MSISCQKDYSIVISAHPKLLLYWTFEEASGNRVDKYLGKILTPFTANGGSVNQISGKQGFAAQCDTNVISAGPVARLSLSGLVSFSNPTGAVSIAGWFNLGFQGVSASVGAPDLFIVLNLFSAVMGLTLAGSSFWTYTSNPGIGGITVNINISATINSLVGTWVFYHIFYELSTGRFGIAFNNGPATYSPFENVASISPSGFNMQLGNTGGVGVPGSTVAFDETLVMIGDNLTTAQLDYLWNSGAGRTWPITLP